MTGLNNKKIGFIVDSSSNLSDKQFDDVKVVPLGVTVSKNGTIKSYKDGIDFNPYDLEGVLNDKDASVKTSQASMSDMMAITQKMCSEYDYVFALPIHKNLSSNINTWKILKEDFPNLNVVMSCDIGYSFAWTIEQIKHYLLTHEPNEQDVQNFVTNELLANRVGFLMVEDLEQLKKGGRVSGIKAMLAKLLGIKPVILFDGNGLTNYDKAKDYEGLFKILDKQIELKYNKKKIIRSILFVPHNKKEVEQKFLNAYKQHYSSTPYEIVNFPTVVVSHTGLKHVAIYVELK